ncbi:hypothetical protein HAZT_HAZT006335 [Hyalella azteca]|uniref:Kringle domain-containing protein n=1 Tax=Hyalella azteca TaxID=294128 RepID=A0A6A0HAI4_HYAAZ|nr:hypothetical protein HAZT_HAZT006335 [Hyalella azteca]
MPACEALPSARERGARACSNIGLTSLREDLVTYSCMRGNGRWYLGTVNKTSTGIPCQRWDSQTPHSFSRPPDVFPEVQGAENYCLIYYS